MPRGGGARGRPAIVVAVQRVGGPSVIESPNATTRSVSEGRHHLDHVEDKYQDVVEFGKASSPSSAP